MNKLKMQTANKADENFKKLAEMFPNAVTETIDENGKPKEKPIKPLPYTNIAPDPGFRDADTAKRVCKRALDKIHLKLLYLLREQKDNDIINLTKTTFN